MNTTTLFVREEATTESSILGMVPLGEDLIVSEELDGWVKISIEEGEGYVSSEYVDIRTEFVKAESKEEEEARKAKEAAEAKKAREAASKKANESKQSKSGGSSAKSVPAPVISGGSAMGQSVASYATQFVGNPYVFGGSSLTNGADCSGFVMSVYAQFGVGLPHSSTSDRSQGYDVGG